MKFPQFSLKVHFLVLSLDELFYFTTNKANLLQFKMLFLMPFIIKILLHIHLFVFFNTFNHIRFHLHKTLIQLTIFHPLQKYRGLK